MAIVVKRITPLLQVFDMPTALAFYRDALGFAVVSSNVPGDNCDWVMLKVNEEHLMLNTAYESDSRPASPDPRRTAAHNDTVIYFGSPDVESAYQHMLAAGLDVKPPSLTGYGFNAVLVTDPDGYLLCFQWPA
ncbi:MAG TPA: VOC family protein [Pyrinomonadaceae bacterium]|nr:VOC family protein [Pyrinomonadaceae bacterium]